jgi:drug/metabolite transporter (DMT)-like permease
MTWWMYATLAAMIWGVHYPLVGKALTTISPITVYFIPSIVLFAFLPFYYKTLISDYHSLMAGDVSVKISAFALMFTSIAASLLLYKAIYGSNATVASLIEITYPVFVALFAFIIFNENHLTWNVAAGGMLIMAGTGLIIYNN